MFPDGEVTIPEEGPVIAGATFQLGLPGEPGRWSVGVGGVTVVRGASIEEALGGVLGTVLKVGRFRPAVVGRSRAGPVWIDCGIGDGFSIDFEALRELMLPLRSPIPNRPPNPASLPPDVAEARSGLVFGFDPFFNTVGVKLSFSFLTGETSLVSLADREAGSA